MAIGPFELGLSSVRTSLKIPWKLKRVSKSRESWNRRFSKSWKTRLYRGALQETPLMPLPPEPTPEEDDEQISNNNQQVSKSDARYEPKENNREEQTNAEGYLVLLVV